MTRIGASVLALVLLAAPALAADRYWVGTGAQKPSWTNSSYWSTTSGGLGGASVPGPGDVAIFDANSGAGNCLIDDPLTVGGIVMANPGFQLQQQQTNPITIGSSGLSVSAGTFKGQNGNITVNGAMTLSGGTLIATQATWTMNGNFTYTGGTFDHNDGTFVTAGACTIGGTASPTFYNLTAANGSTAVIATDVTVENTADIISGGSLAVSSGKTLTLDTGLTLGGTLDLQPDSTLATGGNIAGASGSTFRISGTSQLPGGFATVTGTGTAYAMTLAGNVDVSFARIYDLGATGMTLSGAAGRTATMDNVVFQNGATGATPYLRVTGAAWDGHNFIGMGFGDAGGAKTRAIEIASGGTVYVNGYASGTGWLSGDATDIETSGSIVWGPTAAEGLEAAVRRTPEGNLVSWQAAAERGTVGYILLRRNVERASGLLDEETGGAAPAGHRDEVLTGRWVRIAEIAPASPGGEPVERSYRYLDRAPPGRWEYEVREVDSQGQPATARASSEEKQP